MNTIRHVVTLFVFLATLLASIPPARAQVTQLGETRANTYTTSEQFYANAAMRANGDFVLAWSSNGQDGNAYGIYARRYNAAGVPQGSEFRVNSNTTGEQTFPSVAMDADGDFVVAWMGPGDGNSNGIFFRRYNAAGIAQGSETQVNVTTAGSQEHPTVAMDSSGKFVITWMSNDGSGWDVYARPFDATGAAFSGQFRVNTTTANDQDYPRLAMETNGDFVVTWSSNGQDGSGYGIYAQRYNAARVAQGGEFRVNTTTAGAQSFPSVAMDADGDFAVAWMSDGQDGTFYNISARRYNAAGVAQGNEFRVNTTTADAQSFPSVAMDPDGDFVVAWMSGGGQDGSGDGVYAQRYNAAGVVQDGEFRVNTTTANTQNIDFCQIAMDAAGNSVIPWHSFNQDGSNWGVYFDKFTVPLDTTLAPTLIAPADNLRTKGPFTVTFDLPEAAAPDSVTLHFGGTILYLAGSQESAGQHTFTFDPANPLLSPEIRDMVNGPIADSNYAVTLTYGDLAGNPVATDVNVNIQLDRVTQAPILTSPGNMTSVSTSLTIGYVLPEPVAIAGRTIRIRIASTNNASAFYVLVPFESFSTAGPHSHTFDPASPSTNPDFFSATPIPPGLYNVTVEYQDDLLNPPATSAPVTDLEIIGPPTNPTFTSLYAKNGAVPGAGTDPRIQTGAVWAGFGPPAINDGGAVAYVGKWKAPGVTTPVKLPAQSGIGIFVNETPIVKVGEAVPGAGSGGLPADATFKSLKDPVLDNGGHVAFIGAIKGTGVLSTNDTVVVSNGRTGVLEVIAREGGVAHGTGSATFRAFTSVSIKGLTIGGTVFTASLLPATGSPAVSTANDTGAWWLPAGQASTIKLVREGDPGFVGVETIKSFMLLKALAGSAGQGRGQRGGDGALLQIVTSTNRQIQVLARPNMLTEYAGTGDTLEGSVLPAATWSKMGLPGSGNFGANLSVLGTLTANVGGVTSATARGILLSGDSGATWEPLARAGDAATGLPIGAIFSAFKDPANSSTGAAVAFIGTAKAGGVLSTNNDGIWFSPDGSALALIAREGNQPPGSPANAQWKSFSSLAQPGGDTGPLFTAFLAKGTAILPHPSGITSIDDFAFYGTDSLGTVHQLIRENQPFLGKTAKTFNVLKAVSGSAGVTRSFNSNGQIVALVTFTDATTAIVRIDVP